MELLYNNTSVDTLIKLFCNNLNYTFPCNSLQTTTAKKVFQPPLGQKSKESHGHQQTPTSSSTIHFQGHCIELCAQPDHHYCQEQKKHMAPPFWH